jgi:6-pyruvoyl-tetrahydropterin synthase
MYAVEVRDHIMVAHSLEGAVFGPAQRLHGATYVIDVAFFRETLDPDNIVVDIGRATEAIRAILYPINYANLDIHPDFEGKLTTTEFLARYLFDQVAAAIAEGRLGPYAGDIDKVRVTLGESHVARAWYEGKIGGAARGG